MFRPVFIMAHAPRSMSPKERRDAKNARILIGREDQQDLFMRSLLQPEHREAKLIFSISRQGGEGCDREDVGIAVGYL